MEIWRSTDSTTIYETRTIEIKVYLWAFLIILHFLNTSEENVCRFSESRGRTTATGSIDIDETCIAIVNNITSYTEIDSKLTIIDTRCTFIYSIEAVKIGNLRLTVIITSGDGLLGILDKNVCSTLVVREFLTTESLNMSFDINDLICLSLNNITCTNIVDLIHYSFVTRNG